MHKSNPETVPRERFSSRLAVVLTMIGVAVGLGNVWRFPYMVGKFGGASFVLFYAATVAFLALPALMAEWALGRRTGRGPVGAFARGGLPGGKAVGWFFFVVVTAATAYYTNAVGWVLYYAVGELVRGVGLPWAEGAVLPPPEGFELRSFLLQVAMTSIVILACAGVLLKGLRSGIERASKVIMPLLGVLLVVVMARSLSLDGAWAGVCWYILKFDVSALTPQAMMAAMGQAFFSLSLGGTFMVVYGSYLKDGEPLRGDAVWTAAGDLGAGLLAGLAILPAVIALGIEPGSGPGLLFFTLPKVFAQIPLGWFFGLLFFLGLLGAAYLSDVGAFEVLVAGLTDNTGLSRRQAVWTMAGTVFVFALPPMVNMEVFVPWDLTFGSGMQTLGSLVAVLTFAWCLKRSEALAELAGGTAFERRFLYFWLRWVVPIGIAAIGVWWFWSEVLGGR